ncbi:hypothetical protein C8F01DRAFT_1174937 [Mycena amicta]|nr:hypothetical protein C8F01DRAFT_1174937 [Mycena amicta]
MSIGHPAGRGPWRNGPHLHSARPFYLTVSLLPTTTTSLSGLSAPRSMSDFSSDEDTISLVHQILWQDASHLIGPALLYWDHIITLDVEVQYIWKRRKSMSAYWFFINRYVAFAGNIPVTILPYWVVSRKACMDAATLRQVLLIFTEVVVSVIMILRVYALYYRDIRVVLGLSLLGAGVMTVCVWAMLGQNTAPALYGGCHIAISTATYHTNVPTDLAGAWEALFAFDSSVFALTVFSAYWTRRGMSEGTGRPASMHMPIHRLLIRDGALYFGAMALANLSNIGTFYPLFRGALSTFASCGIFSEIGLNLDQLQAASQDDHNSSLEVLQIDNTDRQPEPDALIEHSESDSAV